MEILKKGLGRRIKCLRKLNNWTQQELADKANIDYSYIGAIERGEKNPTLDFIKRIADGLEIELHQLFQFSPADCKTLIEEELCEEIRIIIDLCETKMKKTILDMIKLILGREEN